MLLLPRTGIGSLMSRAGRTMGRRCGPRHLKQNLWLLHCFCKVQLRSIGGSNNEQHQTTKQAMKLNHFNEDARRCKKHEATKHIKNHLECTDRKGGHEPPELPEMDEMTAAEAHGCYILQVV